MHRGAVPPNILPSIRSPRWEGALVALRVASGVDSVHPFEHADRVRVFSRPAGCSITCIVEWIPLTPPDALDARWGARRRLGAIRGARCAYAPLEGEIWRGRARMVCCAARCSNFLFLPVGLAGACAHRTALRDVLRGDKRRRQRAARARTPRCGIHMMRLVVRRRCSRRSAHRA